MMKVKNIIKVITVAMGVGLIPISVSATEIDALKVTESTIQVKEQDKVKKIEYPNLNNTYLKPYIRKDNYDRFLSTKDIYSNTLNRLSKDSGVMIISNNDYNNYINKDIRIDYLHDKEKTYDYYFKYENEDRWTKSIQKYNEGIVFTPNKIGDLEIFIKESNAGITPDKGTLLSFKIEEEPLLINKVNHKFKAKFKMTNESDTLVLHHAAGDYSVEEVHNLHLKNGWNGIGYHYYIRKDGSIYTGRPEKARGSHAPAKNDTSISICVEGDLTKEQMPEVQKESVIKLGKDIVQRNNIKIVGKHKDYSSTACPGTNYPFEEIEQAILEK